MADVKVDKREQEQSRSLERQPRGGLARRGDWWSQDLFTMNPFSMMRRLSEEMDRAFGTSLGLPRGGAEDRWVPAIEVREEDKNLVVCAELPGLNKDDVRVQATDDGLIIEGERKREHEETSGGWRRSERSYGHFYRMIPLPEGAEIDKANAQFKDGVLEVRVPMSEQKQRGREIPIKT